MELGQTVEVNGLKFSSNGKFNCNSKIVVYLAKCQLCASFYIGKTECKFKDGIYEHL